MNIREELSAFDGKHTQPLEALTGSRSPQPSLVQELIRITKDENVNLQTAATWMLKRYQEQGRVFSDRETERILDTYSLVPGWEAKLHLLQIFDGFTIPASRAETTFRNLVHSVNDENKFVRAWSYSGLAKVAEEHGEFRSEASTLLRSGEEDEAPSVRARIRNVKKRIGWL